jgi:glycosyltransferase involved in cell wall biosynthesis
MAKISVCVATVRPTTLSATIAAICQQTCRDWELIVVGQGPAEGLRRAVEQATGGDARVRYLHSDRFGLSAARNIALRSASGEIFACTDDDCEPRPDWLAAVAACFDADPTLGLVSGSLIAPPPAGRWEPSSCLSVTPAEVLHDPARTPPPAPPGFSCVGGNLALRRAAAERVGRFDELLGAGARFRSGEDIDYLHRLEDAGVKMLSTPRSVVFHTYGRRYGWGQMPRYWHGQGTGHGAIAAKLTLRGDPRGSEEVWSMIRDYPTHWIGKRKPHRPITARDFEFGRLLSDPVRIASAVTTYRHCLRDYLVDEEGLLCPRAAGAPQHAGT